jgi:glycerol kinase
MNNRLLLAIDQGTTSSRAILFDETLRPLASHAVPLKQIYPAGGWVEHDPEEIWRGVLKAVRAVLKGVATGRVAALGITNQRETSVIWDAGTGKPLHNAIVWQDRRGAARCAALKAKGWEAKIARKTGLLLDPYFSATKLEWLLKNVKGLKGRSDHYKDIAFGTIDSWLIWNLTRGRVHATDVTNAARTCLLDIRIGAWDETLLRLFDVPRQLLPEVRDNAAEFGETTPELFGAPLPIRGMAGDQQAAMIGQACFSPGMLKSTYGTGCFAVLNTGEKCIASKHRLLTTIAYQIAGKRTYALEGSIFIAGAAVQWLRDGLKVVAHASEAGRMARAADTQQDVVLVPAFVGLGAPYWDPDCRGALFGLTRNTGPNELARAALQSVCLQTFDLLEAMRGDCPTLSDTVLRADGGMAACDWTMQRLADILEVPVDRPTIVETTALGAAYLAGLQSGFYPEPAQFAERWALDRRFTPDMDAEERARLVAAWHDAVARTLTHRP